MAGMEVPRLNAALQPQLQLALWSHIGFDATRPRVTSVSWVPEPKVRVSFIHCKDGACTEKSCSLVLCKGYTKLDEALSAAPDARLTRRLLTQPLALLLLGGLALLGMCLLLQSQGTESFLEAVLGGREVAWWIFKWAYLAHMVEACCAVLLLKKACAIPTMDALHWGCLVAFVGYPVTRRVWQLRTLKCKCAKNHT